MIVNFIFAMIEGDIPIHILLLQLILSTLALMMVFPVHECAHGLMALAFGDDTAKQQKRLTLNPLAHIDVKGFLFLLLFGFGWAKPVQFDPRNFKNRRVGTFFTAAAGPLSNMLFCFLSMVVYGIFTVLSFENDSTWLTVASTVFYYLSIYNATFAVFNLIPFPPMDGSKIVGELLPFRLRYRYYGLERYFYIFYIVLIVLINRLDFISILSSGLINLFMPLVNIILGGIFG